MKRRILALITALCVVLSSFTGLSFGADGSVSYETAMEKTQKYLVKSLGGNPQFGDEWKILGLARSGAQVSDALYSTYYDNLVKAVKACDGVLSKRKYTEYSRTILAVTAIGKNPKNVGGYNLLEKLADFEQVKWQGINGSIFALIALDSKAYEIPKVKGVKVQTTRDLLIQDILSQEIEGGGFALSGSVPDADITAMALQALSGYMNRKDVKAAVERGLSVLSDMQKADGTYDSWGTKNSESISQVIVALCSLSLNPAKDERFIRNDKSTIDGLLSFYDAGGGFRHVNEAVEGYKPEVNSMASEQAYYALTAYDRFVKGKPSLYDMTDGVTTVKKPAKVTIKSLKPAGSGKITVKWKKVSGAEGYQITYGIGSKFSQKKSVQAAGSSLSKTVKGLKKGKTYYVKVRAYKKDVKGNKVYGDYSAVKKVKVK